MRVKRVFLCAVIVMILSLISLRSFGAALTGKVETDWYKQSSQNRVVDSVTGAPIKNATVSIPSRGTSVVTDAKGYFELNTKANGPLILSVKADGYRPFSLTLTESMQGKPFALGIAKQTLNEIVIDSFLHHLGDDSFSPSSANADDFKLDAKGPKFTKNFFVKTIKPGQRVAVKIGSVIGLDTVIAKKLRQNRITYSASSPAKVFVNGEQVGELKINGDSQRISFRSGLLKQNAYNEVCIETGRNLSQHAYIDYDDMEFMNLILEIE